jgi:hypothetical protein
LPSFLLRFTWVDFSAGIDDPVAFSRLVAGIRGQAPGRSGVQKLSAASPYVRKSVREIMADVLRQEGIDLASMPLGVGATIKTIIRRCQLQYPDLDRETWRARSTLAAPSPTRRSMRSAARRKTSAIAPSRSGKAELNTLLRHVGIRDLRPLPGDQRRHRQRSRKPFFYKDFKQLVGVDLSAKALARAAQGIANLDTRRAEAEDLQGVASHAFDLYLSLRTYQSSFFDIGDALFAACRVLDERWPRGDLDTLRLC